MTSYDLEDITFRKPKLLLGLIALEFIGALCYVTYSFARSEIHCEPLSQM